MKIAVSGLGRMGMQIAKKLHASGHEVIAHNRSASKLDDIKKDGVRVAYSKEEVIEAFAGDQLIVWVMVPSDVIESELDSWLELAPNGSIFIDGGNSDFRETKKRADKVASSGSLLLDVGTSGGVWGYDNGFSMMGGGDKNAFELITPALETLAKPNGAFEHFGESGTGHFVKMTHNAIEYGMMESLAEGYRLLKEGPYKDIDLAAAGDVWQHRSVITSWLNELCRDALRENSELEGIDGFVEESGETRWALEAAKENQLDMPSIQASFDVRLASQKGQTNFATKLLAAMRNKFGGHELNK